MTHRRNFRWAARAAILMGAGAPALAAVPYGATPDWQNTTRRQVGALQIADVNGDGYNDLIVGCYSSSSFPPYTDWENFIHFNLGDGLLETEPSWVSTDEVSSPDLEVGDINNDGFPDIVSINGGAAMSPSVIYYNTNNVISPSPGWSTTMTRRVWGTDGVLFDVDNDGDLDLFVAGQGAVDTDPYRPLYGFRGSGSVGGTLETTPSWASADEAIQNSLAAADFDGDGWTDLAVARWVNFQTCIYRNINGTLSSTPTWQSGRTSGDRGIAAADIDGDGDPDLAVGTSSGVIIYTNESGTLVQTSLLTAPFYGIQEMRMADIDNDGDPDLATVNFSDGRTHIYENVNGVLSTTPTWTYDSPLVGNTLAFGDLNGDGWLDLAIGFSGQPAIAVFYAKPAFLVGDMNCDGAVSVSDIGPFVLAITDPAAYEAAFPDCNILAGDTNGDGQLSVSDIGPFVALLTE
jgi:hypothetical protein